MLLEISLQDATNLVKTGFLNSVNQGMYFGKKEYNCDYFRQLVLANKLKNLQKFWAYQIFLL